MRHQINSFLLNPFVISLFIALVIIFFLPNVFSKYEIKLTNQEILANNQKVFFEDINGDGKSEKIILIRSIKDYASFVIYNSDNAVVDQFNFVGKYSNNRALWFQDTNNNGIKEIYLPTKSNDSIFLNIFEHISKNKTLKEKIYIDKIGVYNNSFDFIINSVGNEFNSNNLTTELFFSINVGFGLQPRNIYKYNFNTKKLTKSNHLTNTIGLRDVIDLNDNGKKIIITNSIATNNDLDSLLYNRSDYYSYLMALNENLDFLFEPIEIKSKGNVNAIYQNKDSKSHLIYLFQSKDKKYPSKLIKVNLKGEKIKEKYFDNDLHKFLNKIDDNIFTVYNPEEGNLRFFDADLELMKTVSLGKNLRIILRHDFDKDGEREWITLNGLDNTVKIYRQNLQNYTVLKLSEVFIKDFGFRLSSSKDVELFMHQKKEITFYKYSKNKLYLLKYLAYLLLYLLIVAVVFLIIKGHEYRENKKIAIEKKILNLQLKGIKNQVDSHFVFNALNTISEMTLSGNKWEVDSFITGYSKFMRSTLEHSDKIATTIKEELEYVENFIKLQQLKLQDKFQYKIHIDSNVNTAIKIPKHCIFTYVENAIKYGLPNSKNGLISIDLNLDNQFLIIKIQDNGIGLKETINSNDKSTGKGLEIMDTIFKLHKQRFNTEIHHSIKNIVEEDKISGVLVTIKIKQNPSKK